MSICLQQQQPWATAMNPDKHFLSSRPSANSYNRHFEATPRDFVSESDYSRYSLSSASSSEHYAPSSDISRLYSNRSPSHVHSTASLPHNRYPAQTQAEHHRSPSYSPRTADQQHPYPHHNRWPYTTSPIANQQSTPQTTSHRASAKSTASQRRTSNSSSSSSKNAHGNGGGKKRGGVGAWTDVEDAQLVQLVQQYGTKNWVAVERAMNGRDKKQCRERWCNHVNPHINDAPFSAAESIFIIDSYVRYGRQWARMSRCAELQNRPDNAIKNHFNTNLRDHYAELCRTYNVERRQPNDLQDIAEDVYARIKGRITAPQSSSMRGSKASRFVAVGGQSATATATTSASVSSSPNTLASSSRGLVTAYPSANDLYRPSSRPRAGVKKSFSYDQLPLAPPHDDFAVDAAARVDVSPYASPPQRPVVSPSMSQDVRGGWSPLPVVSGPSDGYAIVRDKHDAAPKNHSTPSALGLEHVRQSCQTQNSSSAFGWRYGEQGAVAVHLPPISLSPPLSASASDGEDRFPPTTSSSTSTFDHASRRRHSPLPPLLPRSDLDAEHKSLLWPNVHTLHHAPRRSHTDHSKSEASLPSISATSRVPSHTRRYAPYARQPLYQPHHGDDRSATVPYAVAEQQRPFSSDSDSSMRDDQQPQYSLG